MAIRLCPILVLLIFSAWLFSPPAFGAEEPPKEVSDIHFGGFSSDDRMEVKLVTWREEGDKDKAVVKIMDVKSRRPIGRFPYDGSVGLSTEYEALWRPDSRCFGLVYPPASGLGATTAFYALSGTKWVQLPLPDIQKQLDEFSPPTGEDRVITGWHGYGVRNSGIQWLPGDRFRLRGAYQKPGDPIQDNEKGFWVTCRVVAATAKTQAGIVVEKAERKPDLVSVSAEARGKKELTGHFSRGIAPDDRTEVTLLARPGKGGYADELVNEFVNFRDVKSGRVLGSFPSTRASFAQVPWQNLAFTLDGDECAWRSDSRYVALTYVMTRGFSGTTFYGLWHGRWVQIELPGAYKAARKLGDEAGEKRVLFGSSSHGYERFWQWLPRNRFRLRSGYGDIQSATKEAYMGFWVTYRIIDGTTVSKPRVVLEKVEFAPDP